MASLVPSSCREGARPRAPRTGLYRRRTQTLDLVCTELREPSGSCRTRTRSLPAMGPTAAARPWTWRYFPRESWGRHKNAFSIDPWLKKSWCTEHAARSGAVNALSGTASLLAIQPAIRPRGHWLLLSDLIGSGGVNVRKEFRKRAVIIPFNRIRQDKNSPNMQNSLVYLSNFRSTIQTFIPLNGISSPGSL